MRVAVVGERRNGPRVRGWDMWSPAFDGDARSRDKLRTIGLDLDVHDSFNLLPPAPQSIKWCPGEAEFRAGILRRDAWDLLVLLGGRVARAFGVRGPYGPKFGRMTVPGLVVVPHPSGLCRWWNDPNDVRRLRRCLSRVLGGS